MLKQKTHYLLLLSVLTLLMGLPTLAQEPVSENISAPEFTCESIPYPIVTEAALRTAINNANNESLCPGADTIDLGGSRIQLTTTATSGTGLPTINSTLTIQNGLIQLGFGAPTMRLMQVDGTGDLTLREMTLRDGNSNASGGAITVSGGRLTIQNSELRENTSVLFGGAISAENGATLYISNSIISNNSADDGGGLYVTASTATINNTTLNFNETASFGGAIATNNAVITSNDNTFLLNSVVSDDTGGGGAIDIYNATRLISTNDTFDRNSAAYAGAISLELNSEVNIYNGTFVENEAIIDGGAINNIDNIDAARLFITGSTFEMNTSGANGGAIRTLGPTTIIRSTFDSNMASSNGGAIYAENFLEVVNSFIRGNEANGNGGGIFHMDSNLQVTNTLISGNVASGGGGAFVTAPATNDARFARFTNTTIAGNRATEGGGLRFSQADFVYLYNSIIWGNSSGTFGSTFSTSQRNTILQGGTTSNGNINTSPLFTEPQPFNAAPTIEGRYGVYSISPAVDAGNNSASINNGRTIADSINDLNGNARIQNGTVDIGAYEGSVAYPIDTNVVTNAGFADGFTDWLFFGQGSRSIVNEEARFYRDPGFQGATLFQAINLPVPDNAKLEVQVKLGNASNVSKSVEIFLRTPNFKESISCSVTIPPNTAPQVVVVRDITDAVWDSMVISFRSYDPDGIPAIRVDDVNVKYRPNLNISGYSCNGFPAPSNTPLLKNGFFGSGLTYWTLFGGYDFNIFNGEMRFWRTTGSVNPAVLFQNQIGHHFAANSPLRLTFQIGNNSNVTKTVEVFLREVDYAQSLKCTYSIPPNTPMTAATIQLETNTQWSRPLIVYRVLNADSTPAVRLDNVNLQYIPTLTVGQNCTPPAFGSGNTSKAPTTLLPDNGSTPDGGGAVPAPIAPPNPGGIPEIPGF